MSNEGLMLWQGTVRALPLEEQIRVSAAAGFPALTITPFDFKRWKAEGISAADMRAMASHHGVKLAHLDPLTRWAPAWLPNNVDDSYLPFLGTEVDEFFDIADQIGVESFSSIASFAKGEVEVDALVESYGKVCDRAAEHGMRCDLEFIPLWGIPDLKTAWAIVSQADRPNSGIVFDFWHFMRGDPDFELLESIPGDRITGVQTADATMVIPPGRSDVEDCIQFRLPPREGEFPVTRMLQALHGIGGLNRLGPEVFSAAFDRMSADELIEVIRSSQARALDEAGIPQVR